MKELYRVALIGCGQMGAAHLEHIYYRDEIEIISVCDHSRARAAEYARRYGSKRIDTDAHKCICAPDVDIVIIATYPSTHLELLRTALEHGKHVLCEKPIGISREEGEEFVRLVKAHPECAVLVGHILRHNTTYRRAAEMIQNGAIGHPIVIRMAQNHHTMNWERYRRLIEETSPIIDCGVHYMDVMQWFTGEKITDIAGIGACTEPDLPEGKYNYGLLTAHLSGGSIGYYEAGWSNTMASGNFKEFIGPKGSIRIIFQCDRQNHREEGDLIEYYRYPERVYEEINIVSERKPTGAQFSYLLRMIREGIPAVPSIEEVFECFDATLRADEMIREKL